MFDVLIRGGTIVDGTGSDGVVGDIGIKGERIDAIGQLADADASQTINASGKVVSPGFIDSHTHSDGSLLINPQHENGIRQGITTEILGQDGLSYAPLSADNYAMYRQYLSGILGLPPKDLDMSSVEAFRANYHKKVAINTAYNVPHGAIRLEAVGFTDVPLSGDSLKKAKRILAEGLNQGAVGFATGLSYFPNAYSDTEELIELCKVTQESGGVYVTHLRDQNIDRAHGGGMVPEALEIARKSGVKLHFSHYRTYPPNAGSVSEIMAEIDKAKESGADITLELYPYPTGSGYLLYWFSGSFHEGGPTEFLRKLNDREEFDRIANYLDDKNTPETGDRIEGQIQRRERKANLNTSVFSYLPSGKNKDLIGLSFFDAAVLRGTSLGRMLSQVLKDEELTVGFWGAPPHSTGLWEQVSRDCLELLSRPDYMVGSDSISAHAFPHPRAYGTFPRFLGRLRRKYNTMSLEDMVQRMTDNPARRFGLTKRGRLEKGYYADVVAFNADTLIDTATYDDPCEYPVGISHVVVNGQVAVDEQGATGVLAGQAVP